MSMARMLGASPYNPAEVFHVLLRSSCMSKATVVSPRATILGKCYWPGPADYAESRSRSVKGA